MMGHNTCLEQNNQEKAERRAIMDQYKVAFNEMEWEPVREGVRHKVYLHRNTKLRLVEFTQGAPGGEWCMKGHIGYVLDGQLEMDFDGNAQLYGPGDGVFIPAGQYHQHQGKALTETVTMIGPDRDGYDDSGGRGLNSAWSLEVL
jgi:quercetin dioxygenase-like cupin family protein